MNRKWTIMSLLLLVFMLSGMPVAGAEVANDWQCVPNERVGPVTRQTTGDDLIRLFGAENVQRRTVLGAEGAERFEVSVIYPDTPNQALLYWQNNRYGEIPSAVSIRGAGTAWRTVYNITIGTSLEEMNGINGGNFVISGFGWDYGGLVKSWNDGALANVKGLFLTFRPARSLPREFQGDGVRIDSGNPELLPDGVKVAEVYIVLNGSR
ncbi:MAG TPA: hypothetical protein VN611_14215 [Patescibacteria group bacterium]|nr:hypothetical protein [Patescibacteria group bacterium]